ncbi:hypothetical protein M9458_034720, partial [Cirrhinus mrigala]
STPDPELSPPSPFCAEHQPKPTIDREPKLKAINEPSPHGATEKRIAAEGELQPATTPASRDKAEASEIAKRSSTHCTVAEGELLMDLGIRTVEKDLIDSSAPEFSPERAPVSPSSPERAHASKPSPERDSVPKSGQAHKCPPTRSCLLVCCRDCQSPSASWLLVTLAYWLSSGSSTTCS